MLLATILFILMSPGVLLTIPPNNWTMDGIFMSQTTNSLAIFVHGALYFVVLKLIATNTSGLGILLEWEKEITGSGDLKL